MRPLIVGGGPAGAAAAIGLARGGAKPLLLERSDGPQDIVCGGFLGWDALAALERLGLDPVALGARPITRLRVIAGRRQAEAALPWRAAGLSRRTLDEALLRAAEVCGAAIERRVSAKQGEIASLSVRVGDGATITGDALFLATGKHDLRGLPRPLDATGSDLSVGLRCRLDPGAGLAVALAGTIELHLFDRGYAGLLVQEDGSVNLCLSARRSRLGGGTAALLASLSADAPLLLDRIAEARRAPVWQAIAGVPYGWRQRGAEAGLFRLGDQAAVIASLAGDGVAIALASGCMAAAGYLAGGAAASLRYQPAFAARAARPLGLAGAIRQIAEGPMRGLLPLLAHVPGLAGLFARGTRIGG